MAIAFSTLQLDKIKKVITDVYLELDESPCNFISDGKGGVEDLIPHFEAIERRVTALKYAYLAKIELFNAHKAEGSYRGSKEQGASPTEDQHQTLSRVRRGKGSKLP